MQDFVHQPYEVLPLGAFGSDPGSETSLPVNHEDRKRDQRLASYIFIPTLQEEP